ncbi:MAG: SEC-C metal-binding domain-containing protein [Pirellulales bacterium]
MELLENIIEGTSTLFGGLLRGFERGITSLFGSANARQLKKLWAKVEAINALEPQMQALSDAELRQQTVKFRERLAKGETLDDLLVEAFATCREGGRRFLGMRHYDVQFIGGMVLHGRAIAEMVTGEGKTLVATLPAYLNALEGKGVHVITVNDYLARRDMEWMAPLYMGLGLTVGAIQSDMEVEERQRAYACDITYGTNNEFGFDYLRDNMRPAARGDDRFEKRLQQSQGRLNFAIIDEVDNILIDEARTPLIISGPAHDDARKYAKADEIARRLKRDVHFAVNEKDHSAHLTDDGVREAERLAGVESFYTAGNMEWPHLIDNSLKAHYLYKRDVNYVVKEGRVVIVDEFTGRLMEGRQWSDGLHQAVEAKEGVRIKEETQTLATITLQNFFKLYNKICGMTGTAMTEATEFLKIYKLDVIAIPTNRSLQRIEHPDVIYRTEREKYEAIADEIERMHRFDVLFTKSKESKTPEEQWGTIVKETDDSYDFQPRESKSRQTIAKADVVEIERKGRPILVGTVSIEKSERLSQLLDQRGIKHAVLNAKHHRREAEIVAQAGRLGGVTIATNMAGRGTDIILGGNPETMAWAILQEKYPTRLEVPHDEWTNLVNEIEQREKMKEQGAYVKSIGGLHVIGTERHEARRIDLQLRGRCGRQGDPGSSRFFLSLEDDLMRIFAGPWVKSILDRLGMQEGERIESRMVTRRIEGAQKKVEERNFEIRKNLLEYDEVMDQQRRRVYGFRQEILDGSSCRQKVLDMVRQQIDLHITTFLQRDYGVDTFARWAGSQLACSLEGRDFRGLDFNQADVLAREQAERMAETFVQDAIDENLPEGNEDEQAEWNWEALAKFANTRYGTNLRDRSLKAVGRDGVSELLLKEAHAAIARVDLTDGKQFLEDDYRWRSIVGWSKYKFGLELSIEELRPLDLEAIKKRVYERAAEAYTRKEAEYPVLAGLYRFTLPAEGGQTRLDRDGLISWARQRFRAGLSAEMLEHKQREGIRELLIEASSSNLERMAGVRQQAEDRIDRLFADAGPRATAQQGASRHALEALVQWAQQELGQELSVDRLSSLTRDALSEQISICIDECFAPEMRRMERSVLLQIVDTAWKDHLLVMDRLRSSVGLVGYAQVDPKVEYKREGMKVFDQMWTAVGERTTDLIFRMENLDEEFVGSTWVETSARHEAAPPASEIAQQQQEAISASQQTDAKVEPIRNRGQRVGRNDPCPCGSGKKYKQCCLRKELS